MENCTPSALVDTGRKCLQCDAPLFEAADKTTGRKKKYCSQECSYRYRRQRAPRPTAAVQCVCCGNTFERSARSSVGYCSGACRAKLERVSWTPERKAQELRRWNEYGKAYTKAQRTAETQEEREARLAREREASRRRYWARRGEAPPTLPTCETCGAPFKYPHQKRCTAEGCPAAEIAAMCSREGCDKPMLGAGLCGSHYSQEWLAAHPGALNEKNDRRRTLKMNAFVENVNRFDVFERDRWTCHICREPINPELKHPDPRSASIDHVIPLAKGGEHSMRNVRAAHLSCNCSKKDSVMESQIPLFA